jgi:signal transduction histidine kinase
MPSPRSTRRQRREDLAATDSQAREREHLARQRTESLAVAVHDLKNPLAGIKAQAQLLRGRAERRLGTDAEWLVEGLRLIEQAAVRAAVMLDRLSELTPTEEESSPDLRRERVDLGALARDVAAEQQQTTQRHAIELQSPDPAVVGEWDRALLGRVLSNLLANAVKYSPEGGGIAVKLTCEEDAGGTWAALTVRDEGVGIPTEELARVFERSYRGRRTAEQVEGSGLGLAGARQMVEQHGGTISAESEAGAGSTFTVRLPLVTD